MKVNAKKNKDCECCVLKTLGMILVNKMLSLVASLLDQLMSCSLLMPNFKLNYTLETLPRRFYGPSWKQVGTTHGETLNPRQVDPIATELSSWNKLV